MRGTAYYWDRLMQQGGISVEGKFQECDVVCGSRVYPRELWAREIARLEDERRAKSPSATWWTFSTRKRGEQNPPYTRQVKRVLVKRKTLLGDLLAGDERAIAAENEIVRAVLKIKHRLNDHHRDDYKIRERIAEVVKRVQEYVAKADVVDALSVLA